MQNSDNIRQKRIILMINEEKHYLESQIHALEQRERTCYYQAGQAVMAYLRKIPFDYVSVEQSNLGEVLGLQLPKTVREPLDKCQSEGFNVEAPENAATLAYAESLLMVNIAGAVAEMIFIGKEKLETKTDIADLMRRYYDNQDYINGHKIADSAYPKIDHPDYEKWLQWLAYRVEKVFRQPVYAAMVEEVASQFLESGNNKLSNKEVTMLCNALIRHSGKGLLNQPTSKKVKNVDPLPKLVYTENEFCKLVTMSRCTARKMRLAGKLGYIRIGGSIRYTQKHIDEFLAANEFGGKRRLIKKL